MGRTGERSSDGIVHECLVSSTHLLDERVTIHFAIMKSESTSTAMVDMVDMVDMDCEYVTGSGAEIVPHPLIAGMCYICLGLLWVWSHCMRMPGIARTIAGVGEPAMEAVTARAHGSSHQKDGVPAVDDVSLQAGDSGGPKNNGCCLMRLLGVVLIDEGSVSCVPAVISADGEPEHVTKPSVLIQTQTEGWGPVHKSRRSR